MDRIRAGVDFIFSSYKRVAALLIIGGILLAIPVTMSVINKKQDVRQRASEIASEPLSAANLVGTYDYTGTCTSGCTGDFQHTMKITEVTPAPQGNSGTFKGTGFYNAAPSTTWDVTGNYNIDTHILSFHLVYTGDTAGYFADGTGIINADGSVTGTSLSSYNQRGTFKFTKIPCSPRPACSLPGANPVCAVVEPPGGFCPITPTSVPTTTPAPTCTPRPACSLPGANPVCGLIEVPGGYCPITTLTPTISATPTPPMCTSDAQCGSGAQCRDGNCLFISPTPIVNGPSITLYLSLVGIGSTGESGINNNPIRPVRNVEVELTDSTNSGGGKSSGSVTYQPSSGLYVGTIPLGDFPTGAYTTKVRLDNTLWKRLPGIQNITAGQNTQTQPTTLVSGDFNQDNVINLLDYNMLVSCSRGSCRKFFSKIEVKNYIAYFRSVYNKL